MIQINFYKIESLTDIKNKLMGGRDKSRAWDEHTQTIIYKIDNEQGHPIEHRKLYSIFCDHL